MVQHLPGTWRDFVWLSAALAAANLVILILFCRESNFTRPSPQNPQVSNTSSQPDDTSEYLDSKLAHSDHAEESQEEPAKDLRPEGVEHFEHTPISWPAIWFSFIQNDHQVSWLKTFLHPFVFLSYAPVTWAIVIYGVHLSPQVILM